ncbi:hypothetical protein NXC24_PC02025 (plasmid) [Rhizobium sp. NXC24]|nr:hypothetical protein NXC24_PC02025 [Rhizobium sp. NXC24]
MKARSAFEVALHEFYRNGGSAKMNDPGIFIQLTKKDSAGTPAEILGSMIKIAALNDVAAVRDYASDRIYHTYLGVAWTLLLYPQSWWLGFRRSSSERAGPRATTGWGRNPTGCTAG